MSQRRPYLCRLTGQVVVVDTTDGASVRGVLAAVYADVLVLRAATYLRDGPAADAGADPASEQPAVSAPRLQGSAEPTPRRRRFGPPPPPPRIPDVPIDGEFVVAREKVAFLQHLPDEDEP